MSEQQYTTNVAVQFKYTKMMAETIEMEVYANTKFSQLYLVFSCYALLFGYYVVVLW
jgi:hypothetical protein